MIREVFWLRSLACLCVVLIHAISMTIYSTFGETDVSLEKKVWDSALLLLMFATPLFVFLSEFLASASQTRKSVGQFLGSRIKYILVPFLAMSVCYALLTSIAGERTLSQFADQLVANLFLGKFHGYFLLILFQFFLLHVCFDRYQHRLSWRWVLPAAFLVNAVYLGFFSFVRSFDDPLSEYQTWWLPFPGWLFYFCLGYYGGRHYADVQKLLDRYKHRIWLATLVLGCGMLMLYHSGIITLQSSKRIDVLLFASGMIASLFAFVQRFRQVPRLLGTISEYSFSIYLLHIFFLMCIQKMLTMWQPVALPPLLTLIVLFVGSVLLSIAAARLLHKFSLAAYVIGKPGVPLPKEPSNDSFGRREQTSEGLEEWGGAQERGGEIAAAGKRPNGQAG
ncbi:acyltransferase family protein [Brevibacillus sp. TJ4]|uniref:acyltransferase family protein n=1 Tax=Brevibacillus sp. TJ4 TaxID=3234853 RepID=UPI0037CE1326